LKTMNDIMDAKVFGTDHQKCRFTGLPLETGSGALSVDEQAISNVGKLEYDLAELTNRRKDHADKLASETARLAGMQVDHYKLAEDDVTGRQTSLYRLAAQEQGVKSLKSQGAALAALHEASAIKIAEAKAMLAEEGVVDRFGWNAASSWRGAILDKGWSLTS
jgi:hypothetical protein